MCPYHVSVSVYQGKRYNKLPIPPQALLPTRAVRDQSEWRLRLVPTTIASRPGYVCHRFPRDPHRLPLDGFSRVDMRPLAPRAWQAPCHGLTCAHTLPPCHPAAHTVLSGARMSPCVPRFHRCHPEGSFLRAPCLHPPCLWMCVPRLSPPLSSRATSLVLRSGSSGPCALIRRPPTPNPSALVD